MHARRDPPPALRELAARQAGVLSTEQVSAHGLGRHSVARLIRQHRWTALTRGVYWVGFGDEPAWEARAWAGLLVGGSGSALGGAAALHLHGLEPAPEVIDVWCRPGRPRARSGWRFRLHDAHSRRAVGELSRLRVEPALLDLVNERDADETLDLIVRAVQARRTTTSALVELLRTRPRQRHRRLLLDLLGEVDAGIESILERRYAREVERAHGLPVAVRQHRGAGGRRRDNAYVAYGLIVELDGRHHEGAGRHRDMARDNAATLSGERTLRFGWHDLEGRPCEAAAQVAALLRIGGWDGQLLRCRRCRLVPDLTAAISW